ncbi:SusE domain-containing protein [Sphingobacterium hungaricum]
MKNKLNISAILILFISTFFVSCEKEGELTVANSGTSGTLTASVNAVTIDKATLNDTKVTFTLTPSDFGFKSGITYSLEFGLKGTSFTPFKEVVLAKDVFTHSFTGLEFNNLMSSLNLPLDADSQVEVRLKSALSSTVAIYSSIVEITSRPIPLTSWVYVPGAYQNWVPETADSLVSITGNGIYSGVIVFTTGNYTFKITPQKNWNVGYGDGGNGTLSISGGDLTAVTAGAKLVTVDLNTLTYTIDDADVWSVIGAAVPGSNWDKDVDLKFVNDGAGNYVGKMDLVAGEFKFRKNHDWGTSLGSGGSGTLSASGGNLSIATAGNYSISINPTTLVYTLTKN